VPDLPVTIPVLANDSDPDGQSLSIVAVSQPANGTVTVNAGGTITYTPGPGFVGTDRFVYTATDGAGGSGSAEVQVTVGRAGRGPVLFELKYYAVGADTLGGPRVTVYNPDGSVRFDFFAYDSSTRFGANVVLGDLTGDGVAEVITSPGYGGAPHVRVLDGTSLAPVVEFFAFDSSFRGGCTLAVGDVSGDGVPDLAVAAGKGGGPRVFVIDGTKLARIGDGGLISPEALLADYFAFDPSFGGGVSVAISDRDRDGVGEVVTGSGPGGPPLVRVWDVRTQTLLSEFLAFDPSFSAGVNVGARGEFLAFGAGRGTDPIIRVFRGINHELVSELVAYESSFRGGCRVAFGDTVDPSRPLFLTGAGPTGGPRIKVLRPDLEVVLPDYFSFEDTFRGGVFVA